jgi:hypothetical protein
MGVAQLSGLGVSSQSVGCTTSVASVTVRSVHVSGTRGEDEGILE